MSPSILRKSSLLILKSEQLSDNTICAKAILEAEEHLFSASFNQAHLIEILDVPRLFEFLITASARSESISHLILENYPSSLEGFSETPITGLIERIQHFLYFAESVVDLNSDAKRLVRDDGKYILLTLRAVKAMQSIDFDSLTLELADSVLADANEEQDSPLLPRINKSQRNSGKTRGKAPSSLHQAFQVLNLTTPISNYEASLLCSSLLEEQKGYIRLLLNVLCTAGFASYAKSQYIPTTSSAEKADPTDNYKTSAQPHDLSPEATLSTAFPMVQPMKAALYFDNADGFGEWRIFISGRADANLRALRRRDQHLFQIVIKKIKQLSRGEFSADNQKRIDGNRVDVPIFEAKMTGDTRLVYHIDCIADYDSTIESQVIKIFGVYTHAQIDRIRWSSISHQLSHHGTEYRDRVTVRNKRADNDACYSPASFPPLEQTSPVTPTQPILPQEDLENLHALLTLEKYVALSKALLNSIIADEDVAHVFNVSPREKEIIEHPYSCFVLGRSGTGKTTTMLFRMLGIERAWSMGSQDIGMPRQLFVTQSPVLASKVEEYFKKLMNSLNTASYTLNDLAQIAKEKKKRQEVLDAELIDRDDDIEFQTKLPQRFSQLEDKHFPLFLTYGQLCQMLEADIEEYLTELWGRMKQNKDNSNDGLDEVVPAKWRVRSGSQTLITYNIFRSQYWDHFSQTLAKGLDSALVYSEIIGTIKGSEQTLTHPKHFLDKSAYEELGVKASSITSAKRESIYGIFESYSKQKRNYEQYDLADRTHDIIRFVRKFCNTHDGGSSFNADSVLNSTNNAGVFGQKVHYLYVDEAQDNLIIDALLLRWLCNNPNGLFFAGDTAQAISIGSSFRFDDLKAFIWRIEENNPAQSPSSVPTHRPASFQLVTNYRSHGGIVKCAHSVIEIITHFWPFTIDVLAPEKGVVDGKSPVFLYGWDQQTARYEQFLFGDLDSSMEFGAKQCILVRDESAREKLRKQIGDIGLILTLYESKGLEFDDVLLYNFFQDSAMDLSRWRLVLNLMDGHDEKHLAVPRFDVVRHAGLCTELKFLYVAITRARQNIWIMDSSDRCEPMKDLWSSRRLVDIKTPGMDVPIFAASSTPEEWAETGRRLFEHKRYLQAKHCFERANQPYRVTIANAYHIRENARMISGNSETDKLAQRQAFSTAAQQFVICASNARQNISRSYYRVAAACFQSAQELQRAAQCHEHAEDFNDASHLYRKLGYFDDVTRIIQTHQDSMDKSLVNTLAGIAKLFYLRQNHIKKAMQLFPPDGDEILEFAEDYDLPLAQAIILEQRARFLDAAEILLKEGREVAAITCLLKDTENKTSVQRVGEYLLRGLWQKMSFASPFDSESVVAIKELLNMSERLNLSLLTPADELEILMFQCLVNKDGSELEGFVSRFLDYRRSYASLMCLDVLIRLAPLQCITQSQVSAGLDTFELYACLTKEVALHRDPCHDSYIQKLFAFYGSREQGFCVSRGSFLHNYISQSNRVLPLRSDEHGDWISPVDLKSSLHDSLYFHLKIGSDRLGSILLKTPALSPCLQFATNKQCNRENCNRAHIESGQVNDYYRFRVQACLRYITMMQDVGSSARSDTRTWIRDQRIWLDHLYNAIYPLTHHLGTVANLAGTYISTGQKRALTKACQTLCRSYTTLYWQERPIFLSIIMQVVQILTLFGGADFLRSFACITSATPHPKELMRCDDRGYIVYETLQFLQRQHPRSLLCGILTLIHIIKKRLPINISILCDLVDNTCAQFIYAQKSTSSSAGNAIQWPIMIPKSWLRSGATPIGPKELNIRLVLNFIESLGELLYCVSKHNGMAVNDLSHLWYGSSNISLSGPIVRNLFTSRIRRAICLVGHHARSLELRDLIIAYVNKAGMLGPYDPFFPGNRYIGFSNPKDWFDISKGLRQSMSDSQTDVLILVHLSPNSALPQTSGMLSISLKDALKLNPALSAIPVVAITSTLRPEASPFVLRPKPLPSPSQQIQGGSSAASDVDSSTSKPGDPEQREVEIEDLDNVAEEDDPNNDVDMSNDHDVDIIVPFIEAQAHQPSPEELKAANVLFIALSRRWPKNPSREGSEAQLNAVYEQCFEVVQSRNWTHDFYRCLFLGPLPHALVCLQIITNQVLADKAGIRKTYRAATHEKLEEAKDQYDQIIALGKKCNRLHQVLKPDAENHRKRVIDDLKKHMISLEQLFNSYHRPDNMPHLHEAESHLKLALKGIVKGKEGPGKVHDGVSSKPKPKLNTSDLDPY